VISSDRTNLETSFYSSLLRPFRISPGWLCPPSPSVGHLPTCRLVKHPIQAHLAPRPSSIIAARLEHGSLPGHPPCPRSLFLAVAAVCLGRHPVQGGDLCCPPPPSSIIARLCRLLAFATASLLASPSRAVALLVLFYPLISSDSASCSRRPPTPPTNHVVLDRCRPARTTTRALTVGPAPRSTDRRDTTAPGKNGRAIPQGV
jgi:hypothetical protein